QLLRRHQRLVHGALALAVHPQLLAQRRQALVEHGLLAQDPLQLVGHARAKVLHAERLVPAQPAPELLLPDIERGEMERGLAHRVVASLGPNRTVPKRITVAPSSTAVPGFGTASCPRFSPRSVGPAASAASTASSPTPLVTATIVTGCVRPPIACRRAISTRTWARRSGRAPKFITVEISPGRLLKQ